MRLVNINTKEGFVHVHEITNTKGATEYWVAYFISGEKWEKRGTTYINESKNYYYKTIEQAMRKVRKTTDVLHAVAIENGAF